MKKRGYRTVGIAITYNIGIENAERLGSAGQESDLRGARLQEPPNGQSVTGAVVLKTAPTDFILVLKDLVFLGRDCDWPC